MATTASDIYASARPQKIGRVSLPPRMYRLWYGLLALVAVIYLAQAFTPLRLNTDAITLLSAAHSAALGHGLLEDGKPTVFPPGYPSLLALLLKVHLAHPAVIVGLNLAFLGIGLLALRYMLTAAFRFEKTAAVQILLFSLLSFVLIKHVTLALTDVVFLSVVMCSLAVMVRGAKAVSPGEFVRWTLLALATVLLAIVIRRNSIALIPALTWLVFIHPVNRVWFKRVGILPRVGAIVAILLMGLALEQAIARTTTLSDMHADGRQRVSSALLQLVAEYRTIELGELALNVPSSKMPTKVGRLLLPVAGIIVIGLLLAGMLRRRKDFGVVDVFFASYLGILCAWPYYDARFWIAVLPLLVTYVATALRGRLHGSGRYFCFAYLGAFAVTGMAALIYSTTLTFSGARFPQKYAGGAMQSDYCAALHLCPDKVSSVGGNPKVITLLNTYK